MDAELVGGAFLSASLQVLFERLTSSELVNYIRGKKLNDGQLQKLKIKLLSVNAVINDAEEKQFRDPLVKAWLHKLKDAVHDAEDLLDEIATEALGCKLEAESGSSTSDQVRNLMSTSLNLFDREIVPEIEDILDRLEYIAKEKDVLGLKEGIGEKLSKRIPTTSLVDEFDVYGRDDDREAIIKLLLWDDVGGNNRCVIPIVGMGGIGKTTLAKLVYNDRRVEEHFDLQAWICVSEEFDVLRVTNMVLKAVTSHSHDINDLNLLQLKLKQELKGKKFLLVLDDVWNEDYDKWEDLSIPFTFGKHGSKIIVTTRYERVASVMRTIPIYNLSHLADEDCWLLFAKCAFENENSSVHPTFVEICRDILKKCKGIPLALKALGSLLRFKLEVEEWYKILKSEIWELPNDKILPALGISYCCLPLHLKPCFAYCSVFPKDRELEKDQLIQLWMAEGLLDSSKRNKRIEEVGDEYFNELVSRSFFQWSTIRKSHFIIHDLVNDLAKFVSGELCFKLEDDDLHKIPKNTRHLSYEMRSPNPSFKLETIYNAKRLRTFLPLNLYYHYSVLNNIRLDLFLKLRCLRVLCLFNYSYFSELPDSIGTLKYLRYLDLSYTRIIRLPESVNMLYNLQTLKLSGCYRLKKLPMDMHKLINLRYLDISGCFGLEEMPAQMSKLKSLQILSTFVVEKEDKVKIGELGQLSNLRGELCITKLNNVVNDKYASEAMLKDKKYLQKLQLEYDDVRTEDPLLERYILDKLVPHTNLKELWIRNYEGKKFPDWLGDHSFCNMVSVSLLDCRNCCILPPLGQLPSLKDLSICGFDGILTVGLEFYGHYSFVTKPFPSLESLSFNGMNVWQEWCCFGFEDEGKAFPRLRMLKICDCPRLTGSLPKNLPSLTILVIYHCKQLVSSLTKAPICELELRDCEKVGLQELIKHSESCLQHLRIVQSCDTLNSFPLDNFPNLNLLSILNNENLNSLLVSEGEGPDQDLTSLTYLQISQCPNFVSFPKGGLPASNLTSFSVQECDNIKSLPERMHILLPSLKYLTICDCPELDLFPEGGLPSNLSELTIGGGCDKLVAHSMAWHLQSLPSLKTLKISCGNHQLSFPEEGLLPSTLIDLKLSYSCLKTLDNWGLQHLTSLETLEIWHCPNLQSMPQEGLPSSLKDLIIYDCPLLKERCQREKGEDWTKIAHIPFIKSDDDII